DLGAAVEESPVENPSLAGSVLPDRDFELQGRFGLDAIGTRALALDFVLVVESLALDEQREDDVDERRSDLVGSGGSAGPPRALACLRVEDGPDLSIDRTSERFERLLRDAGTARSAELALPSSLPRHEL